MFFECRTLVAAAVALCAASLWPNVGAFSCDVRARIEGGWVCGLPRWADGGRIYASFRGVPYARQPLGHLRFKELEPVEPWEQLLDATQEGPVCPQHDVVYGRLMQPRAADEACIHANVHTPLRALANGSQVERDLLESLQIAYDLPSSTERLQKLPVLVFVHGGGFQGGSGDADLHGPEYLVSKDVVVITFNYRINVFGYLSLNSPEVPGNQALRDMVTLLRWVKRNVAEFGGDPDNVTLMGQSAGASAVHLLTLSKATTGLYKRAFLMSGTATTGFYSSSPILAQNLSEMFLKILGINSTDSPSNIHKQLIEKPIEKIEEANRIMLDQFGLTTFLPTVESEFPGVTRILDEDPEVLVAKGRGKEVPLIIGFTAVECETFRRRLDEINIGAKIIDNPIISVPLNIAFTTLPDLLPDIAKRVDQKYYNGTVDTDGFIKYCTDALYKYPAMKLAETRAASGGAPVFLYEFTYDSRDSVVREALNLNYKGAAHIEDMTFVFRANAILATHSRPSDVKDEYMRDWMTKYVTNFMQCSEPLCEEESGWPPVSPERLELQEIREPLENKHRSLTSDELEILQFFDSLRR